MTNWTRCGFVVLCAGILAVPISGCQSKDPQAGAAAAGTAKNKATGGKLGSARTKVSEEDARQFADSLQRDVASGAIEAAARHIDWSAIAEKATDVANSTPQQRSGFSKQIHNAMLSTDGVFAEVVKHVKAGGTYTLLRIHDVDGETRALFRLALPEAGLNYHDLPLAKGPDGVVKARDFYPYLSGEFLSETFRRGFLPIIASQNRNVLDKLIGREGDYVRSLNKIEILSAARQSGKNREALDTFATLPESVKKEKNILLLRLLSAQAVSEAEYAKAIEDIQREYPNDASIDMLMVDGYVLRKDYPAALGCVDRLDKALGGDPYLDTLRASILFAAGDVDAAEAAIQRVIEREPDTLAPYWTMIGITLKSKHFDETLKWLRAIEKKFHLQFDDMTKVPDYAEFVKSPQYEEWKNDHGGKP